MQLSFATSTLPTASAAPLSMAALRASGTGVDEAARPRSARAMPQLVADQEIYSEGDPADVFFKVTSGVVRTCKFLYDGRRQIDAFHIAGDMFGIEAGADYSYTAEAVCEGTVVSYRRQELDASALTDAGLSRQLFSYAMRSLARAQEHALLLGRKTATEKVATFLIHWSGHSTQPGRIALPMTRQDIADYLGLTIETVSRTLSYLERQGVIELASARQIRLVDPDALQTLIEPL